jgi:hypothetical protein
MKLLKNKIYKTSWLDIQVDDRWTDLDDYPRESDKMTKETYDYIGRFIEEKNGFYIFESGRHYREKGGALFAICQFPVGCLLKAKELIEKKYAKLKKRK